MRDVLEEFAVFMKMLNHVPFIAPNWTALNLQIEIFLLEGKEATGILQFVNDGKTFGYGIIIRK